VLWTADPRLADLADELHVAYVGPA
jgi:hypothetical protein